LSPRKAHRVVVLEKAGENQWKVVEAEIGGKWAVILSARVFGKGEDSAAGSAPPSLRGLANGAQVVLVTNSDKALCRRLLLPKATAEQTRRMAALRLETELPYAVAESTWVCERRPDEGANGDGSTLVMAVPSVEIAETEKQLRAVGIRSAMVTLEAAAVAELAVSPSTPPGGSGTPASGKEDEVVAVAAVGERMTTLTILRSGKLRYARRIFIGASDVPPRKLANELDQCVHHYTLNEDEGRPARLLLVGERARDDGVAAALADRLGLAVEAARLPDEVHIASPGAVEGELLDRFPACLGAVLALHRSLRGHAAAAPALRRRQPRLVENAWFRTAAMIAVNLLLIAGLVAALFGVRKARIAAAERLIEEGLPLLKQTESMPNDVAILAFEERFPRPILDALLVLAETLPPGIKIETLSIDSRYQVTMAGIAPSVEDASEKAISALKDAAMFARPKFLGANKEKEGWKFRLACELKRVPRGRKP